MSINLSIPEYQHLINLYIFKKMKIVRNNNDCFAICSPCFDMISEYSYRIDIETWVDLIKYDDLWAEELNLQEFDLALLASRESDIEITVKKRFLKGKCWKYFRHESFEDKWRWWFLIRKFSFEVLIVDGTEVLRYLDTRDLWDILEGEEESTVIAFSCTKTTQRHIIKGCFTSCLIARMSREWKSEWWLPWAIMSEYGGDFATFKSIAQISDDSLLFDGDGVVFQDQHRCRVYRKIMVNQELHERVSLSKAWTIRKGMGVWGWHTVWASRRNHWNTFFHERVWVTTKTFGYFQSWK
jgi:hypothetical protein